jgi:membrane protease YdiL (CAAX protease family)
MASDADIRGQEAGYFERTHHPLNCLVFILPLLTAYEVGALFCRDGLVAPRYLQAVLEVFGASARFLPPLLIVAVLLIWNLLAHRDWRVQFDAVGGMVIESLVLTVPLFVLWMLTSRLADHGTLAVAARPPVHPPLAATVVAYMGAGIYEEFIFRLAGFGLIMLVLVDGLRMRRGVVVAIAIVATSAAFSLAHFVGDEPFRWVPFIFRAGAGAYLAGLFMVRGFGVAAGVHAFYNIISILTHPG